MFDYIILGHENPDVDSIVSGYLLEKVMTRSGYSAKFIIPDQKLDEESVAICNRYGLDVTTYQGNLPTNPKQKYILVDHHERSVNGPIVAIIDHHPTIQKIDVPYYCNEPSSATACLIVKGQEELFCKEDIQLAILATLVDTASFHSVKTQQADVEWVNQMVSHYHLPYEQLYREGLCLTKIDSLQSALLHGLKEYHFHGKTVLSSYVQVLNKEEIQEKIPDLLNLAQTYLKERDVSLFAFLLHDMTAFQSSVYYVTSDKVTAKDFDHYVSRGNEIIPMIEKKIYQKK